MIEHKGDLWTSVFETDHIIGISTNGFRKLNGQAVMGRGCAKQATELWPGVAKRLGAYLEAKGNVPGYLLDPSGYGIIEKLLILPVKHNWWERASLELVTASRTFLCGEAVHHPEVTFHVPRLGCGNGRLDWATQVRPLMEILPSNVVVHH
jgi:hypothetical protein